ncbi:hypothetical protein HKD37_07G019517 [Glycine soja]
MLGMMLKVDENTSIHSRGNFSQFCVELDLSKELVPSFMVIGREFKLQYEGLHMIFFECGRGGGVQPSQTNPKDKPDIPFSNADVGDEDKARNKDKETLEGLGGPMERARTKKAKEALQQVLSMLLEFWPTLQVEKLRIVNCTMFQEE